MKDVYLVFVVFDVIFLLLGEVFDGLILEVDIDYLVDVKEVYGFWIKFLELYIEVK